MQLVDVRNAINTLLTSRGRHLESTLAQVATDHPTRGTERLLVDELKRHLPHGSGQSLRKVKGNYLTPGRTRGSLDYVCAHGDDLVGFEFKVVRLPRKKPGALFDIGQLGADAARLRNSKSLTARYLVAFVYGPLVADASSPRSLYRAFHNHMFVDHQTALARGEINAKFRHHREFRSLGWHKVCESSARTPAHACVVKSGAIGAVAIRL